MGAAFRTRIPKAPTAHAIAVALTVFVTACSTKTDGAPTTSRVEPESPVAEARQAARSAVAPPRESHERSVDGYKRDAARRIYYRNPSLLFDGAPPPTLKSIVVLSIRADAAGRPTRVTVLRSNGFRDLERQAIQSVHEAAPLPVPERSLLAKGAIAYAETWLFRDDGRFQIRSLAEPQRSVDD